MAGATVIDYAYLQRTARAFCRRLPHWAGVDADDLAQESALAALRGRQSRKGADAVPTMTLSPREIDVLKLLASGYSAKVAAYRMKLAYRTVDAHRTKMHRKTGMGTIELVIAALRGGIFTLSDLPDKGALTPTQKRTRRMIQ